jgi:branched-chain amino acid transport system permease protein
MSAAKIIGIVLVLVILALLPLLVHNPYYMHLFILMGINSVLAMTFVLMLRTGLISLGIAAFWGIGAYASALLSMRLGFPVWLALPAGAVVTGIVSAVIGAFVVRQGGFGFIIQTLAFGFIVVLIFGTFEVFGGHVGIVGIPHPEAVSIPFAGSLEFTSISKTPFYYMVLCLALLVTLVLVAFYSSWAGRAWRSIGLSAHLAESLGVSVFNYRMLAFVLASTISGLMGGFYAHYYGALVPGSFGPFKTIYVHVYAILGGVGFPILGPLIGSLVMTFVPEFLRITEGVEPIFTGILIILLVLFLPDGLLGLTRLFRRGKPAEERAHPVAEGSPGRE